MFNIYLNCVCVVVCTSTDTRRALSVFFHHSLPVTLRQGLFPEPGACIWLGWKPVIASYPPPVYIPPQRLLTFTGNTHLVMWGWDLNSSSPHDYGQSLLTTELSFLSSLPILCSYLFRFFESRSHCVALAIQELTMQTGWAPHTHRNPLALPPSARSKGVHHHARLFFFL